MEKVPAMVTNYRKIKLDCLFMLGGNGSTKTANRLRQEGLNVIALPKTIDNDTWGTDMTFGFPSAIDVATRCIDDIHTTASSHGRVFVIEIMGHKAVSYTHLFYFDENHRAVTELLDGGEMTIDVDRVIFAVGQKPEGTADMGFKLTHGPYIVADAEGKTSVEGCLLYTSRCV